MKKFFSLIFVFAFLLCLSGCTTGYINDFNDNFNGEYKLGDEPPTDYSDFFESQGFGCYSLISNDGDTEYEGLTQYDVSGYPDCLDDYKITGFKTRDVKYKLFGFSVGDSMTKGEDALSSHGYKAQKTETTGWGVSYKRGKIGIRLFGTDTIDTIWVQLETTNKTGAIF